MVPRMLKQQHIGGEQPANFLYGSLCEFQIFLKEDGFPAILPVLKPFLLGKERDYLPGLLLENPLCNIQISVKKRWTTRNPSNFQAFPLRKRERLPPRVALKESSLQLPDFKKRRSKRVASRVAPRESSLRVLDFQERRSKRLAPRVAIRESTLQVPAFVKRRTQKFRKWFPLRISNQRMKRSHKSYVCFRCKKLGHFARRCPQNMCYRCRKQGHFAIRCPQNMGNNKSSLSSSVSVFVEKDGLEYAPPSLLCQCGLRCSLGTRKKNNRKVYTCPVS